MREGTMPSKDDARIIVALAVFVGFLSGVGHSLRSFSDCDPLTETWREIELQHEIDHHPLLGTNQH
jgi:hypothetical protein